MKTIIMILVSIISNTAFAQTQAPCGLHGSIQSRIHHCSLSRGDWALVARSAAGSTVWMQKNTEILWSEASDGPQNYEAASEFCSRFQLPGAAGPSLRFQIPSVEFFESAAKSTGRGNILESNFDFWTSTVYDENGSWSSQKEGNKIPMHPAKLMTTFRLKSTGWGPRADLAGVDNDFGVYTRCIANLN